jgi:hypothetical protein
MFARGDARFGEPAAAHSPQGFIGREPVPPPDREEWKQGLRAGKPEGQPAPVTPISQAPSAPGEVTQVLSQRERTMTPPETVQPVPEAFPGSKAASPAAPTVRFSRFAPLEQNPEPAREVAAAKPGPTPSVPPPPPGATGDIDRLFHDSGGTRGRASSPLFESPSKPNVPRSNSPRQNEAGEFTVMMQGYKPGKDAQPAPMFEEAKPSDPPSSLGGGPGKNAPGEFTMIFQSRPKSAPPPPPPVIPPPVVAPTPSVPQRAEPGEYTRMFEIQRKPSAPPPSAPSASALAGAPPAAPSFALPKFPGAPPSVPAAPKVPSAQPPAPKMPQFQKPSAPPAPALVAPPVPKISAPTVPPLAPPKAAPAGTLPKGAFLVVLIVLGCSFIAAVALILFFALRH